MPKSKKNVNKSSKNSVKKEANVESKKNTTSAKKNTTSKSKAKNTAKNQDVNKRWFKEFIAELKKIIWPKKSELLENSVVVISMVLLVAGLIFVLDLAFKSLTSAEIEAAKRLKNTVSVSTETNSTTESQNDTNSESQQPETEIEVSNELVNDVDAVWTNDGSTENNE